MAANPVTKNMRGIFINHGWRVWRHSAPLYVFGMLADTVEKARRTMRNLPNPPALVIRIWPTTPPSDSSSSAET